MKKKSPPLALRLIFTGMAVACCAVFVTVSVSHSAATSTAEKKKMWADQVDELVRAGLGSEVALADDPADVPASIQSVTGFIRERSGLSLDRSVSDRLVKMEERALTGEGRRIAVDELGSMFADVAVERIQSSSDIELERAADGFANAKVFHQNTQSGPQIPGSQTLPTAKYIRLPDKLMLGSGGGILLREEFIAQAKQLRTAMQFAATRAPLMGLVRQKIAKVVTERVDRFAEALPGQWDRARAGLTPVQAILVAYSAASNDRLWYSNAGLRQMMKASETHLKEVCGVTVSSEGRTAYGVGGYIFSTPLDLALDRQTTSRILDLIEERTSK